MTKRNNNDFKNVFEPILANKYVLYDIFANHNNGDKIVLMDNHICFNSTINSQSIDELIKFINNIINNKHLFSSFKIYLHINSKGGCFSDLVHFIKFKKECVHEIISIIDKDCYDSGFVLASLCNYRIINKNAKVYYSKFVISEKGDYYWNYFVQCSNKEIDNLKKLFYDILCNLVESNLTREKLDGYFLKNDLQVWDCKKYKKLGLADEIV
jgi:ATP-dependent protease ClpP protease subunit